jgi:hypothetical protein
VHPEPPPPPPPESPESPESLESTVSVSPLRWTPTQLQLVVEHVRRLQSDPTPIDILGVTELLHVERPLSWRWHNTMRHYCAGTENRWPPPAATGRRASLKTQSVDVPEGPPVLSWPPDPAVLPPYDDPANGRWRTGTIINWAMRVGRMDLLGRPSRPRQRPGRARFRKQPPPPAGQLARLRELADDDRLVSSEELDTALGMSSKWKWILLRNTRAYLQGVLTDWPPPPKDQPPRLLLPEPDLAAALAWPPHWRVLPPPARVGERLPGHLYRQLWWRAGDLWLWRAQTGGPLEQVLQCADAWQPANEA